jgi:hypothetical protein
MALKITREQLDEYREMLERKASIDIERAAIVEAIEQFEQNAQDQLVASKKEMTNRFGWVFALETGNKSVSWKKEFIKVAGKNKAIELVKAGKGNGKVKLNVTPPQDLAHLFEKAKAESDE